MSRTTFKLVPLGRDDLGDPSRGLVERTSMSKEVIAPAIDNSALESRFLSFIFFFVPQEFVIESEREKRRRFVLVGGVYMFTYDVN